MAKRSYRRFSITEREILYKNLAEGKKQNQIAGELNRDPSTISREISRADMDKFTYRPSIAQKDAKQEALKRKRKYKLIKDQALAKIVEDKLKKKLSPEQISGNLKKEFHNTPDKHVSHETIYRYIYSIQDKEYRESLVNCLRQSRKRRRPRKHGKGRRTTIRDLVSIHERPKEVESREEPGDWEGDLIIGKDHKSAIGTLVERVTRFTIIVPFPGNHSTKEVVMGFAAALGFLPPHLKRSVTYDRGTEMSGHKWFTEITGIPVYFADPYSPWQRGTNENTNGLIRQYFPKGTDFRGIHDEMFISVVNELNERPRKVLDFFSPFQMFHWFLEHPDSKVHDYYTDIYKKVN